MSQVSYLFDEHMPDSLINALVRREPSIALLRIGQVGAPAKGTPDPQVLEYAERERMAIFTHDISTMPVHAVNHSASGRNTFGVFIWTRDLSHVVGAADDLILIWAASEAEEWVDKVEYLPFPAPRTSSI
jgi:hypothetical protein